jgi:hypothetical protein
VARAELWELLVFQERGAEEEEEVKGAGSGVMLRANRRRFR